MPCPAHLRARRREAAALVLVVALVVAGCARGADRGPARALPQPTPDRTLDAVVRGLITVTPPEELTPTAQPPMLGGAGRETSTRIDEEIQPTPPPSVRPKSPGAQV